jgi:hypothetical protein
MKALTVIQPWASLLAAGAKRYETRTWSTRYRGPLLIHASKKMPLSAQEIAKQEPFISTLFAAGFHHPTILPTGVILAAVQLVDCSATTAIALSDEENHFGDFRPGRWAWECIVLKQFANPIPFRGSLGLWEFPDQLLTEFSP